MPRPVHLRLTTSVAAVGLLAGAVGCSSAEDSARHGVTERTPASFTADAPDPGEDLLMDTHQGSRFEGGRFEMTYRLPRSFEAADTANAYSKQGKVDYKIFSGAGPGGDKEATKAAESVVEQAEQKGHTANLENVTIGEKEFTAVPLDAGKSAVVTLYHTPAGGSMFYVMQFSATQSLDEVPPRRIEEFQQSVASLEFRKP